MDTTCHHPLTTRWTPLIQRCHQGDRCDSRGLTPETRHRTTYSHRYEGVYSEVQHLVVHVTVLHAVHGGLGDVRGPPPTLYGDVSTLRVAPEHVVADTRSHRTI